MLKVSSTEVQNNFGKYLLLANEQEIIVTRNGQEVACLSGLHAPKSKSSMVSEKALAEGYGLRKASYEEFLELTKGSEERYELIDGEIFLQASPKTDHQLAQMVLAGTFFNHFDGQSCVPMSAPFDITIRRCEDDVNVVQPDLVVICDLLQNLGEDGYYYGVPTLVVEILSESTRRNDLLKKLDLYMTGGVQEYWVVDPKNKQLSIYAFEEQDIQEHLIFKAPERACSITFPDLVIDLERVFRTIPAS
ncbi:MAG: type II toxin-antitoxin system Phd/YefM family antitoxin [Limnochordia bacterium]|jgi:prevent-host-death family protein|nr:type II toxin-antitoxin system Phd/YefM family antitoxin [Limnochordia bacterium]